MHGTSSQGRAIIGAGRLVPRGSTITTLGVFLTQRAGTEDDAVLVEVISSFEGERYAELVEHNASQRTFVYDWFKNRVAFRPTGA